MDLYDENIARLIRHSLTGELSEQERGELQLADYGISGIPVFQIRPDIKSFKQIPSVFILPGKKAVQHTHI